MHTILFLCWLITPISSLHPPFRGLPAIPPIIRFTSPLKHVLPPVTSFHMYSSHFHASLTGKYVLASFPKTPVYKAVKLLHTPEIWAKGVLTTIGIPRFTITNVSKSIHYGSDRLIQFFANDTLVTLIARGKDTVIAKLLDKQITVKINHDETPIGFSLYVEVQGYNIKDCKGWSQCTRKWMELMLFSLVDGEETLFSPELYRWRDGIFDVSD